MAISRVDTTSVSNTSSTTVSPPAPTGVQPGDLLLVAVSFSRSGSLWALSSYPGWTIALDLAETAMITRVLYRIADGTSADTPPTFTNDGTAAANVGIAAAYRGVDTASPLIPANGSGQVHSSASSTSHAAPAITNTNAGAWAVFTGHARQVATPLTWTPPAGMTELEDLDAANSTSNNCAAIWADSNGAVATGAVTYTGNTSAATAQAITWAAFLRPAAVGGPAAVVGVTAAATVSAPVGDVAAGAVVVGATESVSAAAQAGAVAAGAVVDGATAAGTAAAAAGLVAAGATLAGATAAITAVADPGTVSSGPPPVHVVGATATVSATGAPGNVASGAVVGGATASITATAAPGAAAVPAVIAGATATVTAAASPGIAAGGTTNDRYQLWDGTTWQPIFPVVWDGTAWVEDVLITVTEPIG